MKKIVALIMCCVIAFCFSSCKADINTVEDESDTVTFETPEKAYKEMVKAAEKGDFKKAVGEAVVEELRPVRERYEMLMKDQAYLKELAAKGAESANRVANRTLAKAMKKCGFILP